MADKIFEGFLRRQQDEAMALAEASDLLEILPLDPAPSARYIVRFHCRGLVRSADGEVTETDLFDLGIRFPSDYLRRAEPFDVLTWLMPLNVFHPNIRAPFICIGHLVPGTPLVDIIYQTFETITFTKVTMREDDALNSQACVWARANVDRLPLDERPLKRRAPRIEAFAEPVSPPNPEEVPT